jgi:Winged helix-turn helix
VEKSLRVQTLANSDAEDDASTVALTMTSIRIHPPAIRRRPSRSEPSRGGRPALIDDDVADQLKRDLRLEPTHFGYAKGRWSGELLATHLKDRYAVVMSARQGRRILKRLGPKGRRHRVWPTSMEMTQERPKTAEAQPPRRLPLPRSDGLNKERALRKIVRLASSGLPLEPFVITLLELMEEAVVGGAVKAFLADPGDHPEAFIGNEPDAIAKTVPSQQRYLVHAPA